MNARSSVINLNVLDSILRSVDAEKYAGSFRALEIEAAALTLLTEEDLALLGIKEKTVRKNLLNRSKNLQITTERLGFRKKINLDVDKAYCQLVLNQIYHQLNLHHANLACAIVREDVTICDVKLQKPSTCLLHCVESMENQLLLFENMILPPKKGESSWVKLILKTAAVSASLSYVLYKAVKYTR